jgi:hypothetical protein
LVLGMYSTYSIASPACWVSEWSESEVCT